MHFSAFHEGTFKSLLHSVETLEILLSFCEKKQTGNQRKQASDGAAICDF